MEKQVQRLNALADKPRLTITFQDQYYNMKEIIEKDWTPVELAVQAMESCDIEPIITPFRGRTDGSKISFMGIPRLIYLQVARIFMGNMNSLPLNQWPKLFRRSLPSFA